MTATHLSLRVQVTHDAFFESYTRIQISTHGSPSNRHWYSDMHRLLICLFQDNLGGAQGH